MWRIGGMMVVVFGGVAVVVVDILMVGGYGGL